MKELVSKIWNMSSGEFTSLLLIVVILMAVPVVLWWLHISKTYDKAKKRSDERRSEFRKKHDFKV